MIKVEMALQISQEYPMGHNSEYVWMNGQSWPIPREEDGRIMRLEIFGEELDLLENRLPGGKEIRDALTQKVTCKTWYMSDASYISEQMRAYYPSVS